MYETSLKKFTNICMFVCLFATVFHFALEYATWKNYGVGKRKVTCTA